MDIATLSVTQMASIFSFIAGLFILYGLLTKQKDATIELQKQEIEIIRRKLNEALSQSPDVLVKSLAERIDIAKSEIVRLKQGESDHKEEVRDKECKLRIIQANLLKLTNLIEDSDLVCPKCKAPLCTRGSHAVYGYVGGREVDADIEYVEYECGLSLDGGMEKSPCGNEKKSET